MFFHNYLYRLKCNVRDKQTLFWTLIFPIVLATLFYMAFSNLSKAETFSEIKIGIVDNDEYRQNTAFIKTIEAVSSTEEGSEEMMLFDVNYTSKEEAAALMKDNKIEGYIYFDSGVKLVVKNTGINETIIKSFLDDFQQTSSTMTTIISQDPSLIQKLLNDIANRQNFLKEVPVGKADPDNVVIYFYSLIGMACLYGSFWGLKEVAAIQANQSPQGARISMVPTHKIKVFISSLLAATTVQIGVIFVLLGYLSFVLRISFGNQLGYIILTCIVGTITGVSFGTFISAIITKGEGIKIGILIVFSNIMGFLSGMMYDKMKYIVSTKAPILAYINPLNLITDSLYTLYYYNTYARFFTNIALLCVLTGVFSLITYLVLRRQKYGSL